MLYSAQDPIEGDDDGDEAGEPQTSANDHDGDETVTEHRVITRHKRTGKILSNVRHSGFHGQSQPPRGGSLHQDGSMIASSGSGGGLSSLDTGPAASGSAPAGGSSKPGSMGPSKDGRMSMGTIARRFRK